MTEKIAIIEPSGNITGSVIFLHDSGRSGPFVHSNFKKYQPDCETGHLRLIFPSATFKPFSYAEEKKPARIWFDIDDVDINCLENTTSADHTAERIKKIVDNERQRGIPENRIIIGGHSMGGAMALHMGYRFLFNLAGVFAISTFLNENSQVFQELRDMKREKLPYLFWYHAENDLFVPKKWGNETFRRLIKHGVEGEFVSFSNAWHKIKGEVFKILWLWINRILPREI